MSRPRPLSPHLGIYRMTFTMLTSIIHRLTGLALVAALPFLVWWLVATAIGPESYATVKTFYKSTPGKIIFFIYSWFLLHHMIGGIRHLIHDAGYALDNDSTALISRLTVIFSFAITIIIWAVAKLFGGFN